VEILIQGSLSLPSAAPALKKKRKQELRIEEKVSSALLPLGPSSSLPVLCNVVRAGREM